MNFFIFCLFIFTTLSSECTHGEFELCTSNKCSISWDLALLTTTYVPEFCTGKCCELPTRLGEMTDGFSMHGWWPSFTDGGMPACCTYTTSREQVKKVIESDDALLDEIAYYWPSLSKCHFIEYEYDKHGTCFGDVYVGDNGVKQYIYAAIKLLKATDAWNVMKKAGAVADGKTTISKQTLKNALAKQLGVENAVIFRCNNNKYVSEVRYCTSVLAGNVENPYFMECSSKLLSKDNCDDNVVFREKVSYEAAGCDY